MLQKQKWLNDWRMIEHSTAGVHGCVPCELDRERGKREMEAKGKEEWSRRRVYKPVISDCLNIVFKFLSHCTTPFLLG